MQGLQGDNEELRSKYAQKAQCAPGPCCDLTTVALLSAAAGCHSTAFPTSPVLGS